MAAALRLKGKRPRKYRNQPVVVDGQRFDSKAEAKRWAELKLLEKAGKISCLERQVEFELHADGGKKVTSYIADFVYMTVLRGSYGEDDGEIVVEDVKSPTTAKLEIFQLKKRWMLQENGIEVRVILM